MELNGAHIHLMVNHIPILATLFSIPVLVWGIIANQPSIKKVALVGFIIAGLTAVIAVQSGNAAEEIVESMPGISEGFIEEHEEAAETAQWLAVVLGGLAITTFYVMRRQYRYAKYMVGLLLIYSVAVGAMLTYTAYLGGKIMHPELSGDRPPSPYLEDEYDDD